MPRMDKIDAICRFFNISRSDLIEEQPEDDAREIVKEILGNPDMKLLFDLSRKLTSEQLNAHIQLMKSSI